MHKRSSKIRQVKDEEGAGLVEYSLMLALIQLRRTIPMRTAWSTAWVRSLASSFW
jgi:hypothetical protein